MRWSWGLAFLGFTQARYGTLFQLFTALVDLIDQFAGFGPAGFDGLPGRVGALLWGHFLGARFAAFLTELGEVLAESFHLRESIRSRRERYVAAPYLQENVANKNLDIRNGHV